MALMDSVILPMIAYIRNYKLSLNWMWIPSIVYAVQPWIFKYSLGFTSMTVMNLLWDVSSDLIVSFIGIFIMKERLNMYQIMGIILAITSIIFFGIGRGGVEEYIS